MTESFRPKSASAQEVHETLTRYILADGFNLVFDYEKSHGAWIFDARTGDEYLDLFSFFASQPIGYGHPLMADEDFRAELMQASLCKPSNSDVYTQSMASFVRDFAETCIPESHRNHLFFIEGGGLAVENALKAAFDWKWQRNDAAGRGLGEDLQILHFTKAFHGRTGYTMSLTNTSDPRKYQYFPKFDWPRVPMAPASFPLSGENLAATEKREQQSLEAIDAAFERQGHKIAAIIVETIQGEGGDNHFRDEYLQELRRRCDEREALLIFDEVQCGMGLTGTWWAWQQQNVEPDIFCFGKKSQVCGIAANSRVDEVNSVFAESSRINSTWGGNLGDMVRSRQYLNIVNSQGYLENAKAQGAFILEQLHEIASEHGQISNIRGRGLMIAFDLESTAKRDALQKHLMEDEKVLILGSGQLSLRLRPVLDLSREVAVEAMARLKRGISKMA